MAGMQRLKDEIAGYKAATRGKKRSDEKKTDAASEICQEGLQTCNQRGGGGVPLDYSADESGDTESGDDIGLKREYVEYCVEIEILTEVMKSRRA